MSVEERRARILDSVRTTGRVHVADLVADHDVSAMTIRRDLRVLAQRGLLERVYGGGLIREGGQPEPPLDEASTEKLDSSAPPQPGHDPRSGVAPATTQIGIVVPSIQLYFFPILAGVRRVLDARSLRRALALSREQSGPDELLVRQLLDAGCTGLLLAPAIGFDDPTQIGWLNELTVPTVLIERTFHVPPAAAPLPSVRTAHESGCERAVWHLADLGHRAVAHVTTNSRAQTVERVIEGWRRGIRRFGLDHSSSPLIRAPSTPSWLPDDMMNDLLRPLDDAQVTAVILYGFNVALAFAQYVRVRGWRIPEDISVVAYDAEIADMVDPPLTAVSMPKEWLGEKATELLLELMVDGHTDPVRHIIAEPSLVLRGSTAAPRL